MHGYERDASGQQKRTWCRLSSNKPRIFVLSSAGIHITSYSVGARVWMRGMNGFLMKSEYHFENTAVRNLSSGFRFTSRLSSAKIIAISDIALYPSWEAKSVTVLGPYLRPFYASATADNH
jgi:hypothetical protein